MCNFIMCFLLELQTPKDRKIPDSRLNRFLHMLQSWLGEYL